jgi:predicted transcriptional regulator
MPISSARIAQELKNMSDPECIDALTELLLESLSRNETLIYEYVVGNHPITSRQVSDYFGLPINYVGNILGKLRKFGLLTSTPKTGPDGLYYEWRS